MTRPGAWELTHAQIGPRGDDSWTEGWLVLCHTHFMARVEDADGEAYDLLAETCWHRVDGAKAKHCADCADHDVDD